MGRYITAFLCAVLLATMMVVAFVDLIFVLPDGLRWGLSGAAYLAVIKAGGVVVATMPLLRAKELGELLLMSRRSSTLPA